MPRRKARKKVSKDPSPGSEVAWTRAARQRIGVAPEPGDVRAVHATELCADLSDLCRSWTGYPQAGSKSAPWTEWRELRRRIARADAATEAEARARAQRLRATAEPALRCVISFLFPREPAWSRADAEACLAQTGATAVPSCAELLLGSLDDPDLAKRIVEGRLRADEQRDLTFQALEVVHALGTRAFPVLHALFCVLEDDRCGKPRLAGSSGDQIHRLFLAAERQRRSARRIPKVLEAMELIRTPEVAAFFADRLGRAATRKIAARYFRAAPGLAFRVLPRVAGGRNKAAACARGLLGVLTGEHPDLAEAALRARSRTKPRAAAQAGPVPPDASPDELLPVLSEPLWRHPEARDSPHMLVTVLDVSIPVDPAVHSRDAWVRRLPNVPSALIFSSRIAFAMAAAWLRRVVRREAAEAWLLSFPEIAAAGLVPWAVGNYFDERADAVHALRFLEARAGDAVRRGVARYSKEVQETLAVSLASDPLVECPEMPPPRPRFVRLAELPRPLLAGRSRALPLRAVRHVVEMLIFSARDFPYAGLAQVKATCDQASLDAFVWGIYEAWLAAGAPSRHRWPIWALGELGGDEIARRLVPLIGLWPTQRAGTRARAGVRALGRIGTDIALTHLASIAELSRFPSIRAEARAALSAVAEARGLRPEQLADRTVPDLDVDRTTVIDCGDVSVRAGFDEHLQPFVRGPAGALLPGLPRPRSRSAGAALARAAEDAWSTRKSDVEAIAAAQARRLERAMATRRCWDAETFSTWVVPHRLMVKLLRGLVLCAYRGDSATQGTLFRVTEDGCFADAGDAPVSLGGASQVGIAHPIELDREALEAWGTLLADYEILQPFPQLGRAVYTLTEAELDETALERFSGAKVATKKLLALLVHGWEHVACPGQSSELFLKKVDGTFDVRLEIRPGIDLRHPRSTPEQVLGPLGLFERDQAAPLRKLHPITRSELTRELAEITE